MFHAIELLTASIVRIFRTCRSLWLENLALRQQLVILKRKHPCLDSVRPNRFQRAPHVLPRSRWKKTKWTRAIRSVLNSREGQDNPRPLRQANESARKERVSEGSNW